MIDYLTGRLVAHARWVVAIVALLSLLAAAQLVDWQRMTPALEVEAGLSELYAADAIERRHLERVEAIFGRTNTVVVALYWNELFTAEHLAAVRAATEAVRALDHVASVLSLATVPKLAAHGDVLDMGPVAGADDPAVAQAIVNHNPLYASTLIGGGGNATALYVGLSGDYQDSANTAEVVAAIRTAVRASVGASTTIRMTGPPVVNVATSQSVFTEIIQLLPLLLLAVAVFLALAFRSIRGVLLPLATIAVALLWVFGIIAATGRSLNVITAIVPPVVMTIGLAYAVHLLSGVYRHRDKDDPVRAALAELVLPLSMTVGTTILGFLTLLLSPLGAVREFAWLSALGVLFSGVLAMTLLPAILHLTGSRGLSAPPGKRLFETLARWLAHFDVTFQRPIVITGCAVLLVAGVGTLFIDVGSDYISGFPADAPVRQDFERINADFGGVTPLSVVIQGERPGTFARADMLEAVDDLDAWLESQPEIGATTALPEYIRVLNRALQGGDEAKFRIPERSSTVKQLLLFGSGDLQASLVSSNLRTTRIRVRASVDGSSQIIALTARIRQRLEALPEPLTGYVTGTSVVAASAISEVAGGQVLTAGLAVLAVFLLLSVVFASVKIGAIALLPNLMPVAVYFGTLGFTGIPLNPTTSLIASIVIGIAVDDTMHYLAQFSRDARRFASESRATHSALQVVLRPVTYTSMVLVMGFLILSTSDLQNQMQFGLLAAFASALSWLSYITLMPALASRIRIVTLWDILRLDLGRDPQASIPLFADLRLPQARIFALMARMQRFSAGHRVVAEGEQARDIYVVIDGELRVMVQRDGAELEVARLRRGDVLGEVGYFAMRRSASVDAITPVRLMWFNAEDLERMRRFFPRTAALVLRNMNRIQARRLAETTRRLR